jgi:arginine decarboxylase-like protein
MNAWKMICEDFNLADYWRVLNPNTRRYTWRQGHSKTTLRQSRIDHWLVSIHMMYDLENVDILSSIRSDHSLIELNFYKQDVSQRGPSFWRFNASLLKDSDYIKQITDCFKNAHKKYSELEDKGLLWDLIKMELRSSTICY